MLLSLQIFQYHDKSIHLGNHAPLNPRLWLRKNLLRLYLMVLGHLCELAQMSLIHLNGQVCEILEFDYFRVVYLPFEWHIQHHQSLTTCKNNRVYPHKCD